MALSVQPVTPDRWGDLERLFGPSGAYSGCWCMFQRITAQEFDTNGNAGNRRAMRAIVRENRIPGLIGYDEERPVAWVSVAPRSEFGRVERSFLTKPVDDEPAWAIVCFFVHRDARGTGAARAMLDAAVHYAASQGARLVEAYPVDTGAKRIAEADAWHGTASMFEAAGFQAVIRRRERRPVMRRWVETAG